MTRVIISTFMCLVTSLGAYADVTIEDCVAKAEANYPLISKYRLVEQTAEIDLSDINRSWLPRVGVYGQGTWQNTVPQFPEVLSGV
ncbi:MAG: transporter, partial [Duncaniella sp.]|nr:transporter [Duncaniella sp.]